MRFIHGSLFVGALLSSACSTWRDHAADLGLTDTEQRSVAASVIVDTTSLASTELATHTVLNTTIRSVAHRGGRVRLYAMDAHGSHLVATYAVGEPPPAKAAREHAERQTIAEAERYFAQATKTVFASMPGASPIAAAIGTAAVDFASEKGADLELTVLTDGREVSDGMNLEQQLPTRAQWFAYLDRVGFRPTSLRGIAVHLVGVDPVAATDKMPSFERGLRIRELWTAGLQRSGATSVAFVNVDELPTSLAWLVVFAGAAHWWRRLRVRQAGRRDARFGYEPDSAIFSHLGPCPLPDMDDPEYFDALHIIEECRALIAGLGEELRLLGRQLARLVSWWPNALGITLAGAGDIIGATLIFKDLGVSAPARHVYAAAFVFFLFVLAVMAAQKARDGRPPWWWYVLLGFAGLLCVALVIVRIATTATDTGTVLNAVAEGLIYLASTIGPAVLAEYLLGRLRPVMPLVKDRWAIRRQLRSAKRKYDRAVRYLSQRAKHRQAWQWEEKVLRAVYDRAYRSGGGTWPPTTATFGPIPVPESARPNGKATSWPVS